MEYLKYTALQGFLRSAFYMLIIAFALSPSAKSQPAEPDTLDNLKQLKDSLVFQYNTGQITEAIKIAREIMPYIHHDSAELAQNHNRLGILYNRINQYKKAARNYKKSGEIYKALKDTLHYTNYLLNTAIFHSKLEQFDIAKDKLGQCEVFYRQMNDINGLGRVYTARGAISQDLHAYKKAMQLYRTALNYKLKEGDQKAIAYTRMNMAELYLQKQQVDSALVVFRNTLAIFKQVKDTFLMARTSLGIAESLIKKGSAQKAMNYINEATRIFLADTIHDQLAKAYSLQSLSHKKTNRYAEALRYETRSKEHALNAAQNRYNKDIAVLYARFNMEKQEKQHLLSEKKRATTEQKAESTKHLFIIIVILLLALIVILILIIDNLRKKRQNMMLGSEFQAIQKQKDQLETIKSRLSYNEQKLSAALDVAADAFIEIDLQREHPWYNHNFFKLTGYPENHQQDFIAYVYSKDKEQVRRMYNNCQKYGKASGSSFRLINQQGELIWVHGRCIFLNSLHRIFLVLHDISANKKREEALGKLNQQLKEKSQQMQTACAASEKANKDLEQTNTALRISENIYRTLTNNLPVGICRLNPNLQFTYVNNSLASLFELRNASELTGKSIQILFQFDNTYQNWLKNKDTEIEFKTSTFKGKHIWIKMKGIYINKDGEAYYDAILENISYKKQMEEYLKEAQKRMEESNRLKTQFLENISHEIRTPLNAIIGFTKLLESSDLDAKDQHEYQQAIYISSNQLLNLLERVLDLSAIQGGEFKLRYQEVEMNDMFKQLYHTYNQRLTHFNKGQHIQLHYKEAPPWKALRTDQAAMEKIFINLMDNALKFTNEGAISFGCQTITEEYGEFFVSDTGLGISAENQELIFYAFNKAEPTPGAGGLGIGLSLIRQLINLLEGELWFKSKPDEGTIFHFRLPNT